MLCTNTTTILLVSSRAPKCGDGQPTLNLCSTLRKVPLHPQPLLSSSDGQGNPIARLPRSAHSCAHPPSQLSAAPCGAHRSTHCARTPNLCSRAATARGIQLRGSRAGRTHVHTPDRSSPLRRAAPIARCIVYCIPKCGRSGPPLLPTPEKKLTRSLPRPLDG